MNEVFQPCLCHFVLLVYDDILVYNTNWKSNLDHLTIVREILFSHQLVSKRSKCSIGWTTSYYSNKGLFVDSDKTIAIQQWPVPKSVKDVWGFLGLSPRPNDTLFDLFVQTFFFGTWAKGFESISFIPLSYSINTHYTVLWLNCLSRMTLLYSNDCYMSFTQLL